MVDLPRSWLTCRNPSAMLWGMQRLVFYGKGGIGKSTVSANVSAVLAGQGQRVLHVGCDPKHDSTVALMAGEMIPTVLDRGLGPGGAAAEDLVRVGPSGVHCVEAGGPQAGVGCAGRGISRTIEILEQAGLLAPGRYDAVIFDLLGDVVCGGFAAPLRHRVGEKVVIVSSEEVMSLYAANNVARAVVTYASNGIVCAGILLNLRDESEDLGPVTRFAELLGTPVLGVIRRDPLIREAEYRRTTVVEHAPDAPISATFRELAEALQAVDPAACSLPTPLGDRDFYTLARDKFEVSGGWEREQMATVEAAPNVHVPADGSDSVQERQRQEFKRDLKAGIDAVRRGLVRPEEALARLQQSYPDFTRTLQARDLR
ncbi:MAG: AAA family ATPase [bacterium]